MSLWTIKEVASATKSSYICDSNIDNIAIDSRSIQTGDLFIAIKGEHSDGHDYVKAALDQGAVAAIVHRSIDGVDSSKLIMVKNTYQALLDLAKAARIRSHAKIVAITGSVGKTGLKDMLASVLAKQGNCHKTIGNLNNHFGLPLSLCRMPKNTDFGIFEIGMNHAGEITPLVRLLMPHIAVITAIGHAHMEFFNSKQDIAAAKAEIMLGFQGEGRILLPGDDEEFEFLLQKARDADISVIKSFGSTTNHDYYGRNASLSATESHFNFSMQQQHFNVALKAWGAHYVKTATAALGLVHMLKADLHAAIESLRDFENPKGRGRVSQKQYNNQNFTIIDDAYNANMDSMKAALSIFSHSDIQPKHRYAILGEMLELGDQSEAMHLALLEPILQADLSKIWLIGEHMQPLYQTLKQQHSHVEYYKNVQNLLDDPSIFAHNDAWVLCKGSFGSNIWKIVEHV